VKDHLRGDLPGSVRSLAFGDAAIGLQANGRLMLATLDLQSGIPGDLTELSEFTHAMGRKTAIEDRQNAREQDVQRYPGYREASQKINNIIEKTVTPLGIAFSPEMNERTESSKDTADADAEIFLGETLGRIVKAPHDEFVFE